MNIFKKFRAYLRFNEAVKKADKAHQQTGERFYVMPMEQPRGSLLIMDRAQFRKLRQKHYIPRHARVKNLEDECFYHTSYRHGNGKLSTADMEKKRKQYYSWLEETDKSKKP